MDLLDDGRPVRQRLRLRLPEQSLLVVADDAAAGRSASAHRLRAAVRRWRQRGGPARGAAEASQPARLGDARTSRACRSKLGPAIAREVERVSRHRPRSGAAHSEGRGRPPTDAAAGSRSAGRRAGRLRRPCAADVRSAGAGAAGRRHARHHVPARARNQQPHLSGDRRARSAPSADASRRRSGEDREDGQDQRVPRVAVRLLPGEAEGDAGRRRLAARSFARICTAAAWAIPTCTTTSTCRSSWPAAARAG